MGESKNIYFSDENVKALEKVENRSDLINNLLTEYFNQDIEFLEGQKETLKEELVRLDLKIKQKKDMAKVRAEAKKSEQEQRDIKHQKIKNEAEKRAEYYVLTYELDPLFVKAVYHLIRRGSYNYKKVQYSNIVDFVRKLTEEYGTIDEPTDEFNSLSHKEKESIKRTGYFYGRRA